MKEKRRHFTISQVSERLKIPKHTLLFWEKELNGLLAPLRTLGGQRRYTIENILILEEIKRQRENGLTLTEVVEKLTQNSKIEGPIPGKIDLLAHRVALGVKTEVYNFFKNEKESL